jgi:putative two-component system response regulator
MGLTGMNIPLEGRLMAIADVYDALITVRPYKKSITHEETVKIIVDGSEKHFDSALIEVFKTVEGEFAKIAQRVG